MTDHSAWLAQLLVNLDRYDPEGQATARFLAEHHVKLSLHDQPTGARWTMGGNIQLHPSYADGPSDATYPLSLIVHEARHLKQGFITALSVYGELEAWQVQFAFIKSVTGHFHEQPGSAQIIEELMSLPLTGDRTALRRARSLMKAYAGRHYRIGLLPLYPLHKELVFRLTHGNMVNS